MNVWGILLAGGTGSRMGSSVNKTLLPIAGECSLCRSLRTLSRHCTGTVIVLRDEDCGRIHAVLSASGLSADRYAPAGYDRQASVFNALQQLPEECDIVLVHDAARPFADDQTIQNVITSASKYGTGISSTSVFDTIKTVSPESTVLSTLDRKVLRAVQTPQGFSKALLLKAHDQVSERCTDDSGLVAKLGVPIYLVPGSPRNIKLTTKEDLALAEFYAAGLPRIGHGFDAHRLVSGRELIIGGIHIPYDKGLLGHSDADVLIHAIIDALFGAAALGDIGCHFPDNDPKYKNISSLHLLRETADLLQQAGFIIGNIDATVIAQRPKLSGCIPEMRTVISKTLKLSADSISVKATTTEGMGYEGNGEGISAHAVAVVFSGRKDLIDDVDMHQV